jgi:hypothetical protein
VSLRHQVVVLRDGWVDERVEDEGLRFHFHVRYLREEPAEVLLDDPVLAAFAAAADVEPTDRPAVLRQTLRTVMADGRSDLTRVARDLAHLRVPPDIIDEVWKEGPMPIKTSEQWRYEAGLAEGRVRTITEALRTRFGDDRRIPVAAGHLAIDSDDWLNRILAASSLDDLLA